MIACSLAGAHARRTGPAPDAIAHVDPVEGSKGAGHGPYDLCGPCLLNIVSYWPKHITVDALAEHEQEVDDIVMQATAFNRAALALSKQARAKRAGDDGDGIVAPDAHTEATGPQQEVDHMTAAVAKTVEAPKRQPRANYGPGETLIGRTGGKEYEGVTFAREGSTVLGIEITSGAGFKGKTFDSLSAAAKAVCGYAVSGNMFWKPNTGTTAAAKAPRAAAKKAAPAKKAPAKRAPAKKPVSIAKARAAKTAAAPRSGALPKSAYGKKASKATLN